MESGLFDVRIPAFFLARWKERFSRSVRRESSIGRIPGNLPAMPSPSNQPRFFSQSFRVGVPVLSLLILKPAAALAYIGPGAGFTLGGPALFGLLGLVLAVVALFRWPLRVGLRMWRSRKRRGKETFPRVVVLGLDGLDPQLYREYSAQGLLPNLKKLEEGAGFCELGTTLPAMSPVGWSTFATGTDAGGHNIFDFLIRDLRTNLPRLSSTRLVKRGRLVKLGPMVIRRPRRVFKSMRRSLPFWTILADEGVHSTILRVPITFPPDRFQGHMVAGMCAPDLRGTQGTFTHFIAPGLMPENKECVGGLRLCLQKLKDGCYLGCLPGPELPGGTGESEIASVQFRVQVDLVGRRAHFELDAINDGNTFTLGEEEYSPWISLTFARGPFRAHGICRFRVTSFDDPFGVYVTPINVDPEHPQIPLSQPPHYAAALSKLQGKYATLGLAEDTWALNEGVIDDIAFLDQAYAIHEERRKMLFHALDRNPRGVVSVVFDATDRIQHMFWRYREPCHPANRAQKPGSQKDPIQEIYQTADDLVGATLSRCRQDDLFLVVSDHGFASFRRCVNLNTWFRENGYLFLKNDPANGPVPVLSPGVVVEPDEIDWSRTRAYTNGLAGFYLNLAGREHQGCVQPSRAASLKVELMGKLRGLPDPDHPNGPGAPPAIKELWDAEKCYRGPYREEGPDVLVGYNRGYRADWQSALGCLTCRTIHDNERPWSGDHCMDPSLVPGVLFANRPIGRNDANLVDLAPTILAAFGVEVPGYMLGKNLFLEISS